MNSEKIYEMIDMYFDGELKKEQEAFLFSELSGSIKAREYFKSSNKLKSIIHEKADSFPDPLEKSIFSAISARSEKSFLSSFSTNLFSVVSYAAAIILIVVTAYFYSLSTKYEAQLNKSVEQIDSQNKLINMLYYSMPSAEVRSALDYQVIVTDEL